MAIHQSKNLMLKESLSELLVVADYCVNFHKDSSVWGSTGCYGYPAAILLLSITDSIGTQVLGGNVRNHFNILNHKDYYNLGLDQEKLGIIYKFYRCPLVHEAIIKPGGSVRHWEKRRCGLRGKERTGFIKPLSISGNNERDPFQIFTKD